MEKVVIILALVQSLGEVLDTSAGSSSCSASDAHALGSLSPPSALLQVERKHVQVQSAKSQSPDFRREKPCQKEIQNLKERLAKLEGASPDDGAEKMDWVDYLQDDDGEEDDDTEKKKDDKKVASKKDKGDDEPKPEADEKEKSDDDEPKKKGKEAAKSDDQYKPYSAPAWNGLEKVNARPSESAKGIGVASGVKYKGKEPYEEMMDYDYVIDSNIVREDGGKTGPSSPAKAGPKPGSKAGPRLEGKKGAKPGSKSQPNLDQEAIYRRRAKHQELPARVAKTAPKHSGRIPSKKVKPPSRRQRLSRFAARSSDNSARKKAGSYQSDDEEEDEEEVDTRISSGEY